MATSLASASTNSSSPTLLHSVWHTTWLAATASPIVGAMFVLAACVAGVQLVRLVIHGGYPRDPVRRFTRTQRRAIIARAGKRCEHHSFRRGRCPETTNLEADHVHPWSRGGQTHLSNAQALCHRHNRAKLARIPFGWQLRALETRRAAYYPPGVPRAIVRRGPHTQTGSTTDRQQAFTPLPHS